MVGRDQYIIIAGTNKAGTTSLFKYLGDHPDICPSNVKQTNFFLDKDYPLLNQKPVYDYESDPTLFEKYFPNNAKTEIKLEATPDYMYSEGTPEKMARYFKGKKVKIIFILREPLNRLMSWFKFGKQIGQLPEETTLAEFIEMNKAEKRNSDKAPLVALETGNYSNYIRRFFNYFEKEKISIYFFEEMTDDPERFMGKMEKDLGISEGFYENYEFEQLNKSQKVNNRALHSLYANTRKAALKISVAVPGFNKVVKAAAKVVTPMYRSVNMEKAKSQELSDESISFLESYYAKEYSRLKELIGSELYWNKN